MDTYTTFEHGLYGGIKDFCGNQHPVLIKTEIDYNNLESPAFSTLSAREGNFDHSSPVYSRLHERV